jgi:hypothetical protein
MKIIRMGIKIKIDIKMNIEVSYRVGITGK